MSRSCQSSSLVPFCGNIAISLTGHAFSTAMSTLSDSCDTPSRALTRTMLLHPIPVPCAFAAMFAAGTHHLVPNHLVQMVARAPTRLSVCEDMVIDLSGSYGTAGRSLNYTYGIYPNVPNDLEISTMLFEWSTQQKIDRITIPYELIEPGIQYRVVLYVTNFLRVFQRRERVFERMPYAIPSIQVGKL